MHPAPTTVKGRRLTGHYARAIQRGVLARDDRLPTIRDVARHAGVSVATVSRVLNDVPVVSADMRDRVRESIACLGYRPSSAARSLSLGRSQAIGVVAPFFTSPSVVERLRGVAERARGHGYGLMLFDVETAEQRAAAFSEFARRDRVDGLLVISLPLFDDDVEALARDRLPVVMVDCVHPRVPHVAIDDALGGELAAEHLLGRGHRRIGFVGDEPDGPLGFTSSEDRRRGFRRALRRAGVRPESGLECRGRHGRAQARALADALLRRPDRPTAVFAASDTQAVGVLEAAHALGLRVPEDVAVIGFDDIEIAEPLGLSTVRQPLRQSGARGADLLLGAIAGAGAPGAALAPLEVVARRTT
jgi:DNA-binding LacI/PurR family transcriptional regulator